jgi:hypothetical protein
MPDYGDETITVDVVTTLAGDQTYMTQDDDEADLMQRKPTKAAVAPAKPPLKSAMKKSSNEATTSAKATPAAAVPSSKGRITAAEKRKREVSGS